ncbi:MAG: glycosyltransferase family 4 protein [Rhizobacter sp.]|nr:glycosyltransferase family 4 protein [Rhizobacter sp.]
MHAEEVLARDVLALHYDVVYLPLGAASYGGAERSLIELASAQMKAGLRVLVVYEPALAQTDFVRDAAWQGLPLLPVEWSPEAGFRQVCKAAAGLFRRLNADIVQFNISWRPYMWLIPIAARLLGRARLLGTMRAMPDRLSETPRRRYLGLFDGPPLRAGLDLFIGHAWARTLHLTVSVNRDDYPRRLVDEFGFDAQRLMVIQNGVRLPDEVPTPQERRHARKAFAIPDDVFAVAYVGRVSSEKGIRYAIEALALCDLRVELFIAGDGPELGPLQQLTIDTGLVGRVHFLGYLADPKPLFTGADAVVVPSLCNEAFGRVVVEAMGCATPVIATAVGGMQELFESGREGMMVPKADAVAIAGAIEKWAADGALWASMSDAARELAVARYSTARVAGQYSEAYSQLRAGSRNGHRSEG